MQIFQLQEILMMAENDATVKGSALCIPLQCWDPLGGIVIFPK
jgi:hypothetical protein